jgi:hypothetical protein
MVDVPNENCGLEPRPTSTYKILDLIYRWLRVSIEAVEDVTR